MYEHRTGQQAASHSGPTSPAGGGADWLQDLASLNYRMLFPLGQWWAAHPWDQPLVRAILFAALGPMLISVLVGGHRDPWLPVALICFYFAMLWAGVLWLLIQPQPRVVVFAPLIAVFTVTAGLILLIVLHLMTPVGWIARLADAQFSLAHLLGHILGVAPIEESVKLSPILFLVLRMRALSSSRDIAYGAALSGLAFGAAEAIDYSFRYGRTYVGLSVSQGNTASAYGLFLANEIMRLASLVFAHGVWSAIAGYFVGLATVRRSRTVALIAVGLGISICLHGLYNTFVAAGALGSLVAIGIMAIGIFLLVGYTHSIDDLATTLVAEAPKADRSPMLAYEPTEQTPHSGSLLVPPEALTAYGRVVEAVLDHLVALPPSHIAARSTVVLRDWRRELEMRLDRLQRAAPPVPMLDALHAAVVAFATRSLSAFGCYLASLEARNQGDIAEAQRWSVAAEEWRPRVAQAHEDLRARLHDLAWRWPEQYAALRLSPTLLRALQLEPVSN